MPLVVKNPPADAGNVRDVGLIPRSGRSPRGGHGNPLQYSSLENLHEQRSLVGCSPWGCKESNMTEWLSTAQHSIYGMYYFLCLVDNRCSTIEESLIRKSPWTVMVMELSDQMLMTRSPALSNRTLCDYGMSYIPVAWECSHHTQEALVHLKCD